MQIDLTEAMVEPTDEEIDFGIRKFISFNIQRDKITREIVDVLQAADKAGTKYVALKLSLLLAKEMSAMFIQGKFFGLPVIQDVDAAGYSVTPVTQEEMERDAKAALKLRPAVRPEADAAAGESP